MTTQNKPGVTEGWQNIILSEERLAAWRDGKLSSKDLLTLTDAEMLQLAMLAFSQYEQGRYEDAEKLFLLLANLDPNEGYYRTALGTVYLALNSLEKAVANLTFAISLSPNEIAPYVNRGESLLRQGDVKGAIQDFEHAKSLDPDAKDPLTKRALVLAQAAQQRANPPATSSSAAATGKAASKPTQKSSPKAGKSTKKDRAGKKRK